MVDAFEDDQLDQSLKNFSYGDFRGVFVGCRALLLAGATPDLFAGLAAEPCPAVRPERVSAIRLPCAVESATVTLIVR